MDSIIAKLNAIQKRAREIQNMYFTPPSNVFIPMRDQFFTLKDKITKLYPDLTDFSCQDYDIFKDNDGAYRKFATQALITDIDYYLNYFKSFSAIQLPDMKVSESGIYFPGQHFDALLKFHEIISKARNEIIIIDNYFNEKVLNILTSKKETVNCKILTQKKSINTALQIILDSFKEQYGKLDIRFTDKFHDRFVILDQNDCFHFGASIKDLGRKGFMYSKIEEQVLKHKLLEFVNSEWENNSTP